MELGWGRDPGKLRRDLLRYHFPARFSMSASASRLVSCDISLKQRCLGKLACTQERWVCSFPPHLQMGAGTKPHPLGYTQQVYLLPGKNLQRESRREKSAHIKKN